MSSIGPPKTLLIVAATFVLLPLASCHYGPAAVKQPAINPSRAGRMALEMYDTNGDGRVAGEELQQAPGLQAALSRLDANGDGAVTADEVAARVQVWRQMRTGLTSFDFTLTLDGSPLQGATVTFEPEAFLGQEIQAAVATTDSYGGGRPTIPKELRPDPERTPPGVHIGLYQVKVSKIVDGKETIPAKYNEQTTLGQEVAPDVPEIGSRRVAYALSTK